MSIHYAWQKFFGAALSLAEGDKPAAQRLAAAFLHYLSLLRVGPTGLESKPKLEQKFDAMYAKMTAHGTFEQSVAELSELEVRDIITDVMSILDQLARELGAEEERFSQSERSQ